MTDPGTTGLRLWYKFDETTGIAIADSSGNNYKGEVNSMPKLFENGKTGIVWDSTGGYDGSGCFVSSAEAISDFNMSIEANSLALTNTQTSLTLSIWVNGDTYMPLSGWARLICAFQDLNTPSQDENEVLEIDLVPRAGTSSSVLFQAGMDVASGETAESNGTSAGGLPLSAFAGSWQHYAFVRSGGVDPNVPDANDYNKIRIYHNGEMVGDANALKPIFRTSSPFPATLGVESFRLIRRNQGAESWYGKIDDFRVYNRALTKAEIGWLGTSCTNCTPGYVPFVNASNLKSSTPEKISFNDFAVLAGNWLAEGEVWPEWDAP
jgi:hypothetical protein